MRNHLPILVLVALAVSMSLAPSWAADLRSEVVTVAPPTGQPSIVDGPDGAPPSGISPRLPEIVYVEPMPAPSDPPAVVFHCVDNAGDCGRAVANACNATGHGAGASSQLAWCPNDTPVGSQVACCKGTCADQATVTCKAGG